MDQEGFVEEEELLVLDSNLSTLFSALREDGKKFSLEVSGAEAVFRSPGLTMQGSVTEPIEQVLLFDSVTGECVRHPVSRVAALCLPREAPEQLLPPIQKKHKVDEKGV